MGHQAALVRDGLRLGLCEVRDVVQWADHQLARLENPPYELIELSLLGSSVHDAASKLRELSESISVAETLPVLLSAANKLLQTETEFGPILAEALYQIYIQNSAILPESFSMCGYFDDAYSLATSGTFGTLGGVYRELLEFTAGFKSSSNKWFESFASLTGTG